MGRLDRVACTHHRTQLSYAQTSQEGIKSAKGQIKPKTDSPKKRTNERICLFFAMKSKNQKNQICSVIFWENLWITNLSVFGFN